MWYGSPFMFEFVIIAFKMSYIEMTQIMISLIIECDWTWSSIFYIFSCNGLRIVFLEYARHPDTQRSSCAAMVQTHLTSGGVANFAT